MMSKWIRTMTLGAAVLLALPAVSLADSGHDATSHKTAEREHRGHGDVAKATESLAEAWTALVAARDAIASDVKSDALGDVHARAEPLPQLVDALLVQSADLEAGKRQRVEGAAKQVKRVADALHVAADQGDAARSQKALGRLDGLLKLIQAQYPAGALMAGSNDHGGHSGMPSHGAHAHGERPAGVVDAVPQATVRVQAFDPFRFEPSRIELQAGVPTRIELENVGVAEHSLVVKTPDGARDWVHLHVSPGTTEAATYQIDEPGTYSVECTIPGHTAGGMIGELVVLAGHGAAHSGH